MILHSQRGRTNLARYATPAVVRPELCAVLQSTKNPPQILVRPLVRRPALTLPASHVRPTPASATYFFPAPQLQNPVQNT